MPKISERDDGYAYLEYLCSGCGKRFEVLILGSEQPHCPKCNSTRLEQQLSAFAVAAGHGNGESADFGSESAPGCGSCGMDGGPCGFDDD
jgi:putative FmdB family regulatory protein